MNIDFIKDPVTIQVLEGILSVVGPNYNFPHDSDTQPSDGAARNEEELTQFDLPAGAKIKSVMPPSGNPGMGTVISSLLVVLSPVITAYSFLLPIFEVIKGIIEVICCLMNPFCVGDAVGRLFSKYIPAFLSLLPPLAAMVLIKSVIKLIIAIVFFIMTEIVPPIQLIIKMVECIVAAVEQNNREQFEACKKKLIAIIIQLLNKIGVLGVFKPILDIIFMILWLFGGFPCQSGAFGLYFPLAVPFSVPPYDQNMPDTFCCNDSQCPPEIATPPTGQGLLIPTFFGDAPDGWSWILIPITGHANIPKLIPYLQDFRSQLNPQLDEEIDEAIPVGSTNDAAHFRLRILGRRGEKFCRTQISDPEPIGSIVVPIARISGYNVIITNRILYPWAGIVDYCVEPNFEQLIARNILAVSCHPSVIEAKEATEAQFGEVLSKPAADRIPEIQNLQQEYADFELEIRGGILEIQDLLVDAKIGPDNLTDYTLYTLDDIPKVEEIQERLLDTLTGFADKMKEYLNIVVSRMVDKVITVFGVDKHVVHAGGVDKAIISVTPMDTTGAPIMRTMPADTVFNVELLTDFGTIQNQALDSETGTYNAELISAFPGTANVMAKVNEDFVTTKHGETGIVQVEQVRFIADAVLPKRRHISKSKARKGVVSEREPGSR